MLERRFKAVPGVIDVTGWGGKTKTYEVTVDLRQLLELRADACRRCSQVLNNSNVNVGGQTVNFGAAGGDRARRRPDPFDGRDRATRWSAPNNGSPVLIGDVATVTVGNLPRLGIAGQDDDDDIVQGIVLMRRGEQSLPTIHRVEAEVDKINSSSILPPGVHIEQIYDRTDLINVTTHTVLHNMIARHRADLLRAVAVPRQSAQRASSSPPPSRSPCSSRSRSWCCAASRPTCCRSARSISGWSSMPP